MTLNQKPSSIAQRARQIAPLGLTLAAAVLVASGCSHRRQSMRPVLIGPARVVPSSPCASGDCGGSVSGSTTTVSPGSNYTSPLDVTSPPPASVNSEPARPGTSGGINEPRLDPATPGAGARSNSNSTIGSMTDPDLSPASLNGVGPEPASGGPRLEGPESKVGPTDSQSLKPTQKSVRGNRRLFFRRNLQAYVNDPADLYTPPRADRPWRYVVLHHSAHNAGGLAQIDRDHRDRLGTAGCGYHFVIGNGTESPDGQIEVAERWSMQKAGAHCRDSKTSEINDYGIGICFVGDIDSTPPTPKQLEAARNLIAYLQDRYEIPSAQVVVHDNVAQTATTCPGKMFPTRELLADLNAVATR